MKIHKGTPPPKRHECVICGQKFHKPVYLRNHLLRHKEMSFSGYPQLGTSTSSASSAAEQPPPNNDPGGDESSGGGGGGGGGGGSGHGPSPGDSPGASQS